jgi:ubiquinone/menaquinone biosynthesis C-methylase UbiE
MGSSTGQGVDPAMAPRATHESIQGFERNADAYERGRPGYPAAALEYLRESLGVLPGDLVLELGAGTGKLTRGLQNWDARVLAVEPLAGMRAVFRTSVRGVELVAGTAEAIPVKDRRADAVVVAQSFHWFRQPTAVHELARVLVPEGGAGLVWNIRDESVGWAKKLGEIIDAESGAIPRAREGRWRAAFETSDRFEPLVLRSFPHHQSADRATILDRVLSISAIGLLPEARRAEISERVLALLDSDPATRGQATVTLPYRTDVHVARRRPD